MSDQASEGVDAYVKRANFLQQRMALHALRDVYGDAALDPDAALKMQAYGQNEKLNPIAVDQAQANLQGTQLENTGREQTNVFNEEANPLKLKGLELSNTSTAQTIDQSAQAFPLEQQQRQANIGATKAQTGLTTAQIANVRTETAARGFQLQQASAAANRNTAFSILSSLTDVANQGGDIGTAFDQYAPMISKLEGVDPKHMAPLKAMLVADPQGTIAHLTAALTAQNMVPGIGGKNPKGIVTPEQRMQQVNAMKFIAERDAAVPNTVNQALSLLPKMSSSAIIRKAQANIPGTPEYQFGQLMHNISSNLSLDDLRTLRATGFTLGRTNIAEFQGSASAIANMDIGQDPKMLAGNLTRIGSMYRQMNEDMKGDISRMSMGVPGLALKPQAPRGTAGNPQQFQEGTIYQDANGNKARFQGGKFIPVQ